jgi:hypothetical protein
VSDWSLQKERERCQETSDGRVEVTPSFHLPAMSNYFLLETNSLNVTRSSKRKTKHRAKLHGIKIILLFGNKMGFPKLWREL